MYIRMVKEIDVSTIQKAISNGIAYATEDRKSFGLILIQEIKNNITWQICRRFPMAS